MGSTYFFCFKLGLHLSELQEVDRKLLARVV